MYPSINVLMEYIALEQLSPFLKPNWLSLAVKKVAYRSSKQCSHIFNSTGQIDIPQKSFTIRDFPIAWPSFGKGTMYRPNAGGKQQKNKHDVKKLSKDGGKCGMTVL